MNTREQKSFEFDTPTPATEPVQLGPLLQEIRAAITAHVIISPQAATALAVWIVHTYVFKKRDAVAYVAIESPEKRCGKTTFISVLAGLASKSLVASNVTVGALFRAIDEAGPTLFIDEADTFLAGNGVMRGILNCGNTWRTAFVLRLAPKAKNRQGGEAAKSSLIQYCCWCPKVIAMIGKVPDTIADRSIVVSMQRKLITEKCLPLTQFFPGPIVSKCARFAADNGPAVAAAEIERIEGLNDRASDTFEPLAVLARMAGEEWHKQFVEAVIFLSTGMGNSLQGAGLLLDILTIFVNSGNDKIFSRILANTLRGGDGWIPTEFFGSKKITETLLAQTLRPYGIRPTNIRIGSEVNRGYRSVDFRSALNHYVPRADIDVRLAEIEAGDKLRLEARKIKEEENRQKLIAATAKSLETAEAEIARQKMEKEAGAL